MKNRKVEFLTTIPESATFAEIPAGTPALLATHFNVLDQELMAMKGETYIRLHGRHVGYSRMPDDSNWFYLFAPTNSLKERK